MRKQPLKLEPSFWREIGLEVTEWVDSAWFLGTGKTLINIGRKFNAARNKADSPLDWNSPYQEVYHNAEKVLYVAEPEGRHKFLPQVLLLGPPEDTNESTITVDLQPMDFQPIVGIDAGLEFYRSTAEISKQEFYNAENARLVDWCEDSRTLTFQGCLYFDYLKTNLSLDLPLPALRTLRKHLAPAGQLEPLNQSQLANTTGIDGLIFSNDGHMIFQKRLSNVLLRRGELCSGFSGTLDKIDVEHTVASGGSLRQLDAPREMVEELGVRRSEVAHRSFLGITRELIRGGAPEMFFAINIGLSRDEILSRIPSHKEGKICSVYFGPYATADLGESDAARLPGDFANLCGELHKAGNGPVSISFLTNLVLWYQRACPGHVGTVRMPTGRMGV